ncbi:glycosyltransferase family 2 protein [Sorangium sp. So ce1000]|uniref:glycosyltransferase family 2 protein n=1 Tax=Sorangium sp. So ce1000 TaxID=3133325 RepID=UPI003F6123DD
MDRTASAPRGGRLLLRPLAERPRCSIVIPCYNEEDYIEDVLRCAVQQHYPPELLEVFVVDGGSTDRTREIVDRIAAQDPRVMLLHNPARIQSAAMNVGIRRSRGEVIIRMDAHADYADDYVAASVAALQRTGALNAGGAARARYRNGFQRALCTALSSPLGVGGSAYRDPSREGFVETVFNGAFRREAFEIAGLYDPAAITNEDAELNQRIIEAGGAVYLSRDIVAYYYPRSSFAALVRQYFAYGKGRARTLLCRRKFLSLRPALPFFMVTGFALLALGSALVPAVRPALALASLAYAALVIAESLRLALRASPRDIPLLCAIFPALHVAHGLGFWAGLLRGVRDRSGPREAERLPAP